MFTIRKSFEISASHCLSHLPANHPCSRTHGHNYVITVELADKANQPKDLPGDGFVLDYRKLETAKALIEQLDHQHLNDHLSSTTSEHIAYTLYNSLKRHYHNLQAIEVSETPKTTCRYEPRS